MTTRTRPPSRRLLLAAPLALVAAPAWAQPAASKAERVFQIIDALDVEHRWPAGVHVDWRTGLPDGGRVGRVGLHTHCSAFVAAAAMRLGVYVLRPPEHAQTLLANAQYLWLGEAGPARGWRPLKDAAEARAAADQGDLVLAAYRNPRDDKPGHIAIVRPARPGAPPVATAADLDVTQAGARNYRSAPLAVGFAGHPGAVRDAAVRFFAHAVDAARLG